MTYEWTFDVHFTTSRPIIVDEHCSRVTVLASSYPEAMELAAQLGGCRDEVEMVTRTQLVI